MSQWNRQWRLLLSIVLAAMVHLAWVTDAAGDVRLEAVSENYRKWLTVTGLSEPSTGWKLEVSDLRESECTLTGSCSPQELKYVLFIALAHPEVGSANLRHGWAQLNDSFGQTHGVTLDERLAYRLAHMLGASVNDVQVWIQASEGRWLIQGVEGRPQVVYGDYEAMQSAAALVTKDLDATAGRIVCGVADANVNTKTMTGVMLGRLIETHFRKKTAMVRIVAVEDNYLEAFVDTLKGEVVSGKQFWERLQMSFLLTEKGASIEIRLLLDGQFSAGLNPPPLTAFVDMEPIYSKDLQIYAGALLILIKQAVEEGRQL